MIKIIIFSVIAGLTIAPVIGCSKKRAENPASAAQYAIPAGEAAKWESVKLALSREDGLCREHCGNDKNCFAACDKARESRLEREYQKLMYESRARQKRDSEVK